MAIDFEIDDGVALITLNRPERLNAMDAEAYRALSEAWMRVRDDDDDPRRRRHRRGRAVVHAPAPTSRASSPSRATSRSFWNTQKDQLLNRGLEVWKPVIAAINGYCLGGGHDADAGHRHPGRRRARDLRRWPRSSGASSPATAARSGCWRSCPTRSRMELLLTGDRFDAATAERWGLVNRVVPMAELMDTAMDYARRIAANAPLARAGREGAGAALARHGPRVAACAWSRRSTGCCSSPTTRRRARRRSPRSATPRFEGR